MMKEGPQQDEMPLKHHYTLNNVTALAFCKHPDGHRLLAAEGHYLKIFRIGNAQRLIAQCRVFREQTIHGITVADDGLQVVIWGGSSIAILLGFDLQAIVEGDVRDLSSRELSAPDWTLSIALSPCSGDFVLLTAHNSLLRATFQQDTWGISFQSLDSPARSILYSACILHLSSVSIMVAAGTVFGKIIVWHWQCSLGESPKVAILFTFAGHEGSIFGVHISPRFHDSNGNAKRLLASCSDDRTIRLWDLSPDSSQEGRNADSTYSTLINTGFGSDGDAHGPDSAAEVSDRCLSVAWGHTSRIWDVLFSRINPRSAKINLLSFGEDATCQLWSIDLKSLEDHSISEAKTKLINTPLLPDVRRLQHCKTFAYHGGKHIWAAGLLYVDDCHCLVATGGADGKLSCFKISLMATLSQSLIEHNVADYKHQVWTLDEVLLTLATIHHSGLSKDSTIEEEANKTDGTPPKKPASKIFKRDEFNRFSFITENMIILTSTVGRVFLGTYEPIKPVNWQEIHSPSASLDLIGYSVITSISELGLAVFAAESGNIYKLRNGIELMGSVNGKVAALFMMTDQTDRQSLHLLVTVLGGHEAFYFSWNETISMSSRVECSSVTLPPKFIITSASKIGEFLYIGFRNGAIGVLDPRIPMDITLTYRPPVGEDADTITSMIEILPVEHNVKYILATSRNGTYMVFSSDIITCVTETNVSMVLKHHSSPPLGAIEKAWIEGLNLYFYGFRGKEFVVWNETDRIEVMAIECGGAAHRSYAYSHHKGSPGGGILVYTKASKLYIHSHETQSHQTIKDGGHGREIKACAVSGGKKYFATGAEDTTIRIWKYHENENRFNRAKCLSVIEKHTAGIQHLQWQGDDLLCSSGGAEELYIWAIQEIPHFGIGVIREATLLDQSPERDLRITSFDIKNFPLHESTAPAPVPAAKTFLISLAFSDSTIKSYSYSRSHNFRCIATARHTSSCLTQLRYLPHHPPPPQNRSSTSETDHRKIFLLTAGTDGHLTTWSFPIPAAEKLHFSAQPREPIPMSAIYTHAVHQNAIHNLDISRLSDRSFIVATGGDDNALAFTHYGPRAGGDRPQTTIIKNAHAAAVTALTFLHAPRVVGSAGQAQALRLASSGNDQRVKIWNVSVRETMGRKGDGGAVAEVELVADEFTAVADVGDMAVLTSREAGKGLAGERVLVVGSGMDVWVTS